MTRRGRRKVDPEDACLDCGEDLELCRCDEQLEDEQDALRRAMYGDSYPRHEEDL